MAKFDDSFSTEEQERDVLDLAIGTTLFLNMTQGILDLDCACAKSQDHFQHVWEVDLRVFFAI
jgi:hypothetical protein